jgi:hypothetical protein
MQGIMIMATTTQTASLEKTHVKSSVRTEVSAADRAMGAAMISSGIGSLVLGILIVLAEVSVDIKEILIWNDGAGPLSGKTGVAVIAFVVSWVVLHYIFQYKAISLTASFIVTAVLLVLGLLLTFPPIFISLAG